MIAKHLTSEDKLYICAIKDQVLQPHRRVQHPLRPSPMR
jgi:hypothetical protein